MEHTRLAKTNMTHTPYWAAFTIFLLMLANAVVGNAASPVITQKDLLNRIESGTAPLILDVRTPGEYQSGHVPQAINIPHNQLSSRLAELLDAKHLEVVTYCELGPRAGFAEAVLQEAGFSTVHHLVGDMSAWRRDGLPIERP